MLDSLPADVGEGGYVTRFDVDTRLKINKLIFDSVELLELLVMKSSIFFLCSK